ncbi:WcaI family glycosyltransferase [Hymenobacter arizonensis]|uniref:Colanic acid biosynthesis glycosyl transferase WcaI n=1 Tax=Hymenobacter arizonensis TaxID=1227077 RepID=A0A1I6BQ33_HYMAR|nr:WcaI family glycosyltransferase [Hymenobacter arizonensis]SFQ83052.1 colanic acid biosynthesis glycosyl transferase WcaI [Hymenobacter arizonensis]
MKKRILLIGYNYFPEPTGIGKYNGEMMGWLAQAGHACSVLTTYPYYPYWKVQEPYANKRFSFTTETQVLDSGASVRVHRVPMYVPEKPSGLKRIIQDFTFTLTAFVRLLGLFTRTKFDCVIVVAPSFQFGLLSVLCKKVWGATFVYHIQDLQIEAARDLRMIRSERAINALFAIEKFIFRQADFITTISGGMVDKVREKANKEVLLFPNWTDVDVFSPSPQRGAIKQSFGFDPTDQVVLYSGAIGEKQGLEVILRVATEFAGQPRVKFLICGSGPYKQKLEELAGELKLENVLFFPLQPSERFNEFLNLADVHLVIQKANASDLVMPSKLTTILSVGGVALITANPGAGLYELVHRNKMGILVEAESLSALSAGLRQALNQDNAEIAANARAYAEQHLSVKSVMNAFAATVLR